MEKVKKVKIPRFHRRPEVVRTVESMPTGRRPHVCPSSSWLMQITCSPCAKSHQKSWRKVANTDRVKHPANVIVGNHKDARPRLAQLVQVGKGMDRLVETTGESTENDNFGLLYRV